MRNLQHPLEEELSAYIDDMLDVPSMRHVAEHVAQCEPCRLTCLDFHRNKEQMRQLAVTPAESGDFWAQAYARLEIEHVNSGGQDQKLVPVFRTKAAPARLKWIYSLAATLVAATIVVSPQFSGHVKHTGRPHVVVSQPAPAEEADAVDVSLLVGDHTSAASQQPLADPERQAMLAADSDSPKSDAAAGVEEIL